MDFHFPNYFEEIFLKTTSWATRESQHERKQVPLSGDKIWETCVKYNTNCDFPTPQKSPRSRWPEISVKMVRWDMAKPRHVFHRIGMISIYRGQQHKRICWFCQGVPNSPLPYRTQDLLIKSFLGVKIDVVYPMTLEECKGHTRSARIELQDI